MLTSSQLLEQMGESLGKPTLPGFALKKASVWMDSPFLGGLAAPCTAPGREHVEPWPQDSCPSTIQHGKGHQSVPFCTAPAPGETWALGLEEGFWQ